MVQSDQDRQDGLVVSTIVLTTLSCLVVLVRSVIRFFIIRNPGWDDGAMIAALLLAIGYMIAILVARSAHIGFPAGTLSFHDMTTLLQATYGIELMYYGIIYFIKASILFTYLRFIVSEGLRKICWATLGLLTVFFVLCIGITAGQCNPPYKMWDVTFTVQGACINTTAFFYATSAFNILTDIWILALPIKTLKGINRPHHEKIALFAIFGIGSVSCIMSIVRLHSIYTYTLAEDPFHEAIAVNVWSEIEFHIAILCASVPALKPIFSPRRLREISNGNRTPAKYQYHGSERSGDISGGSSTKPPSGTRGSNNMYGLESMPNQGRKGSTGDETDSTTQIMGLASVPGRHSSQGNHTAV